MIISEIIISLSNQRIFLACVLVMVLALTTWRANLKLTKPLLIASFRLIIQLSLVGLILEYVFEINNLLPVALIAMVMLLVAGREVSVRQKYRISGRWSYGIGTSSMFVSSFAVSVFGLAAIIRADNWWEPRYSIPVLGMPVINSMAIAGIVSLPGMMTGQILAGNSPNAAVRYQIVIWLLIAAGCGFGSILVVKMAANRVFDERQRLRIDRIYKV